MAKIGIRDEVRKVLGTIKDESLTPGESLDRNEHRHEKHVMFIILGLLVVLLIVFMKGIIVFKENVSQSNQSDNQIIEFRSGELKADGSRCFKINQNYICYTELEGGIKVDVNR